MGTTCIPSDQPSGPSHPRWYTAEASLVGILAPPSSAIQLFVRLFVPAKVSVNIGMLHMVVSAQMEGQQVLHVNNTCPMDLYPFSPDACV